MGKHKVKVKVTNVRKISAPDFDHDVSASFSNELLCSMPRELTAENGAKGLLSGEFHQLIINDCPCCGATGWADENELEVCECCNGEGANAYKAYISWTNIKEIYAMAVKHLGT